MNPYDQDVQETIEALRAEVEQLQQVIRTIAYVIENLPFWADD